MCTFLPIQFLLYSRLIMRNLRDTKLIKLGGHDITNLRCANGTVLKTELMEDL